jgi:hypothetical protein
VLSFWSLSAFDGAEIYRSESANGAFHLIRTENGPPPYYDRGLNPNSTYWYKVRLFRGSSFGPMSEAVSTNTGNIFVEGLNVRPYIDASTVELFLWSRSVFDGAEIYRSDTPNGIFQLVKRENGAPPYYDAGLRPNADYWYRVRLFKDGSFGQLSEAIAVKTNDIIAEYIGEGRVIANSILITWWSRSDWDYAEVYRSNTGNENDFRLHANAHESPFYDYSIVPGNTYHYKIRLVKNGHVGPFARVLRLTVQ